jgi:hypothetical protein
MELSPRVNLKPLKTSSLSADNDLLMASISDLSLAFQDDDEEEEINQKDRPFNYLMSSLRSFVDGEDFPEDILDDWPCDCDDEIDFNASVKDLLSSVNDLLHSKTTFTLNEGTSLETEMMRLKRFSRRTPPKEKWQPNVDPLILGDSIMKGVRSTPDEVQRQKEKLANVLKDALGEKEEESCKAPKIKTDHQLKPSKPLKPKPLNPNRFVAANKCDSAPVWPVKRRIGSSVSPIGRKNSTPVSPDNHPRSLGKRWDSECPSPVKRSYDSAPRSPRKRPNSPFKGPRLPGVPCLDDRDRLPVVPCLDEPSGDPYQQANVSAPYVHDGAPKKPTRMQSGRHLLN